MAEDFMIGVEKVHGDDDRVVVDQLGLRPWRSICALRITAANGEQVDGTGFLIGPSAVLTTAHNIFDHARGGQAQRIRVIPALSPASAPFGDLSAVTFRTASGWQATPAPERDYGAILLSTPVGNQAGTIRCRQLTDVALSLATLTVAGYPIDLGPDRMVRASGQAAQVTPGLLVYDIDTNEGQSGSPILVSPGGVWSAVGIHISGDFALNQGVRVNATVFAEIETWRTQHA
jgi:V8-like Glu-specific endopeptidase